MAQSAVENRRVAQGHVARSGQQVGRWEPLGNDRSVEDFALRLARFGRGRWGPLGTKRPEHRVVGELHVQAVQRIACIPRHAAAGARHQGDGRREGQLLLGQPHRGVAAELAAAGKTDPRDLRRLVRLQERPIDRHDVGVPLGSGRCVVDCNHFHFANGCQNDPDGIGIEIHHHAVAVARRNVPGRVDGDLDTTYFRFLNIDREHLERRIVGTPGVGAFAAPLHDRFPRRVKRDGERTIEDLDIPLARLGARQCRERDAALAPIQRAVGISGHARQERERGLRKRRCAAAGKRQH